MLVIDDDASNVLLIDGLESLLIMYGNMESQITKCKHLIDFFLIGFLMFNRLLSLVLRDWICV